MPTAKYKASITLGTVAVAALVFGVLLWLGRGEDGPDLDSLRGDNLDGALGELARAGQRALTYDEVWAALEVTEAAPGDAAAVLLFYSGRTAPKVDKVSGRLNPDHGPDSWNREHLWPRSRGVGEAGSAATDLHHIRATDVTCNETRGALDFDRGGGPVRECNFRRDGNSIEPRDAIKGDLARMLFYMDVRYDGADGEPDLRLVPGPPEGESTLGHLCRLLSWHIADPLERDEIARHDRIVAEQGNRNPFVDRPDIAAKLFGPRCR